MVSQCWDIQPSLSFSPISAVYNTFLTFFLLHLHSSSLIYYPLCFPLSVFSSLSFSLSSPSPFIVFPNPPTPRGRVELELLQTNQEIDTLDRNMSSILLIVSRNKVFIKRNYPWLRATLWCLMQTCKPANLQSAPEPVSLCPAPCTKGRKCAYPLQLLMIRMYSFCLPHVQFGQKKRA